MLQELNRAIEYIEEHLTDELYLEKFLNMSESQIITSGRCSFILLE